MQKKFPKIIALLIFVSVFMVSCGEKASENEGENPETEMVEAAENADVNEETLPAEASPETGETVLLPEAAGEVAQGLLEKAGLSEKLSGEGPFTLLLPSDEVLTALGEVSAEVLNNHLIEGTVNSFELEDGQELTTLGGKKVAVKIEGGVLTVGGAVILQDQILAKNGLIHRIDKVLE